MCTVLNCFCMSGMRIRSFALNSIEEDELCRLQVDDRHHGFDGADECHAGDE